MQRQPGWLVKALGRVAIRPLAGGTGPLLLAAWLLLALPGAVKAAPIPPPMEERYVCAGDPLIARVDNGAVDTLAIPNVSGGTVPGAFVVLRWRDLSLQLPRTNNAGAPSYSDGKWFWSVEDTEHPRFLLRRGAVQAFDCRRP
jgi:hypothetical protein